MHLRSNGNVKKAIFGSQEVEISRVGNGVPNVLMNTELVYEEEIFEICKKLQKAGEGNVYRINISM